MPYKSRTSRRKYRSTKVCPSGKKSVRSHKRLSGKKVKSYCRKSTKRSTKRSTKSRCGAGKVYVKSFKRSNGTTTGGFCASKSYKKRRSHKSKKVSQVPKLITYPIIDIPTVQPSVVQQPLLSSEDLGMDFKPLTERLRKRSRFAPKQGIFGSLKSGLDKGKQLAAKAQSQVTSAIQKGQELTKKAEELQAQAAKKAEEFQKAAEKIQAQAEQAHSQYQEAKQQLTDVVGSTGLAAVSPAEIAKETAKQIASTVIPAMRMKRRY